MKSRIILILIAVLFSSSANAGVHYNKWTVVRMHDSGITDQSVGYFQKQASKPYMFIIISEANRKEKAFFGKGVDDYIAVIGGKQYFGGPEFNVRKGSLVTIVVDNGPTEVFTNQNDGQWAIISINSSIVDKFKKGYRLNLGLQATNGSPLAEISLIGFTKQLNIVLNESGSATADRTPLTSEEIQNGKNLRLLEADELFEPELKKLLKKVADDAFEIISPQAQESIDYVKKINPEEVASQAIKVNEKEILEVAKNYVDYVGLESEERQKYIDGIFEMIETKVLKIIVYTKQKTLSDHKKKAKRW